MKPMLLRPLAHAGLFARASLFVHAGLFATSLTLLACSPAASPTPPASGASSPPPPSPVADVTPATTPAHANENADAGSDVTSLANGTPTSAGAAGGGSPAASPIPSGCTSAMFDEPPAGVASTTTAPTKKEKPFATSRQLPTGRLGGPVLDRAVGAAVSAFCAAREEAFYADARREQRDGRNASTFYNECSCLPTFVSDTLVSVACASQASLAGAHPGWRYAGFTFALEAGQAKAIRLEDVCAPAAKCQKRIAELLPTLTEGPRTYHEATLNKYLARPTFVMGPTSLRILVDEELSGYAAHGLSCDVAYTNLGALSKLRPPPPPPSQATPATPTPAP